MRRSVVCATVLTMVAAACGGGGSASQPQSEEGALASVKSATEGALQGKSGAVFDFMSAECRAAIDEDDVRLAVSLAPAFFNDLFDGFELGDVEAVPTIISYDGDSAEVAVEYRGPDGEGIDTLGLSSDNFDIVYDGKKWVDEGCEYEDTTESDREATREQLEALGYAATREDPIPRLVGAPVGEGYTLSVDAVDTDAAAALEALGGFVSEPEAGQQFVLVTVTVGYSGSREPRQLTGFSAQMLGGTDSVGYDSFGCGSFPTSLNSSSTQLFSGGVRTGALCFPMPASEIPGMLLSVEAGFSDQPVFFDPTAVADTPVPVVGASGPSPDGDYTEARQSPTPLGEPVDLGDGWTITVTGFESDATATLLGVNDFNDPPPEGFVYSLLEYQLDYNGEDEPQSAFSVSVDLVGDSNVSADNSCGLSDVPNEIDNFVDLFKGASVSGAECFIVDEADLDSLVVFANADFFSDDTFALAVR